MRTAPEYSMKVQARIPAAVAAIHDFIRIHDPQDNIFRIADDLEQAHAGDDCMANPPEYLNSY